MQLISESLTPNLDTLTDNEVFFNEGDTGELRLYVDQTLSQEVIKHLESEICSQGVMLTAPITQDARIVVIKFQKAIAPLIIIAGVVGVTIAGLLGWQLFKVSALGLPLWAWVAGGIAAIYAISRRSKWLGKR